MTLRRVLLSAFGVGFLPAAPGTWASAATTALVVLAHGWGAAPASPAILACAVLGCAVTLALGGGGDPSWVVTDEVAGQAVALGIAAAAPGGGWLPVVLAFVLFRVFDVWKPGPIGALERRLGGAGVLAVDLGAGILAGGLVAAAKGLGLLS